MDFQAFDAWKSLAALHSDEGPPFGAAGIALLSSPADMVVQGDDARELEGRSGAANALSHKSSATDCGIDREALAVFVGCVVAAHDAHANAVASKAMQMRAKLDAIISMVTRFA